MRRARRSQAWAMVALRMRLEPKSGTRSGTQTQRCLHTAINAYSVTAVAYELHRRADFIAEVVHQPFSGGFLSSRPAPRATPLPHTTLVLPHAPTNIVKHLESS